MIVLRRRALHAAALLGALAFSSLMGAAAQAADHAPATARQWLQKMQQAVQSQSFQGTVVSSSGAEVSSSRILHLALPGPQQLERLETLDGPPRRVLRHNEVVHVQWPERRMVVVEQRDPTATFPSVPPGEEVLQWYEGRVEGSDRIAGMEARVILLAPRDAWRYAQRLWAERDSGLLLRADVLAPDGQMLESVAFSELSWVGRAQPEPILQAMQTPAGWKRLQPRITATQLEAQGWALKSPVAGFREVRCVQRAASGEGAPTLQAVFSDGLTHISMFIESFRPDRHKPMQGAIGATHTLSLQRQDVWLTFMGDVPMATLKAFAAALERRR